MVLKGSNKVGCFLEVAVFADLRAMEDGDGVVL